MICLKLMPLLLSTLIIPIVFAQKVAATETSEGGRTAIPKALGYSSELPKPASPTAEPWPVETSLKSTLQFWAHREGWPTPQFLTQADWPVDVPGSITGSIEDALKIIAEGFGKSSIRPRIELSANHVILLSEIGAE